MQNQSFLKCHIVKHMIPSKNNTEKGLVLDPSLSVPLNSKTG